MSVGESYGTASTSISRRPKSTPWVTAERTRIWVIATPRCVRVGDGAALENRSISRTSSTETTPSWVRICQVCARSNGPGRTYSSRFNSTRGAPWGAASSTGLSSPGRLSVSGRPASGSRTTTRRCSRSSSRRRMGGPSGTVGRRAGRRSGTRSTSDRSTSAISFRIQADSVSNSIPPDRTAGSPIVDMRAVHPRRLQLVRLVGVQVAGMLQHRMRDPARRPPGWRRTGPGLSAATSRPAPASSGPCPRASSVVP